MLTRFRRNTAVVVLALSVGALTAACNPVLFTPSGGATNTCPAGNWTLSVESITAPLSTFLGDATISTSGSGVQLVINPSNTWTLTADQTVHVTIATPNVDLTGTVKGTVNGTYSGTGSTISFATTSITGTVQYSGTALGHSISGSIASADARQRGAALGAPRFRDRGVQQRQLTEPDVPRLRPAPPPLDLSNRRELGSLFGPNSRQFVGVSGGGEEFADQGFVLGERERRLH